MDLTFDKEDLERLVRGNWQLVCGRWKQANTVGQWLTIKDDDGLYLNDGSKKDDVWKHSAGDKVLPLPKFTLAQFKAFCDWHPTFEWEAITSVFTNDDGTLDDVALAELDSRGRAACALVRGVLVGPDDEYLKAWGAHCRIDMCRDEIDELKSLKPTTITEKIWATQELEKLEAKLAELLKHVTDPAEHEAEPQAEAIDLSMLADPGQLIDAFGRYTNMDASWFDKWKDHPALNNAIKRKGTSGRGRTTEPLFCPFLVMQGLMKKPRRGSNRKEFLTDSKPWELLKRHFPNVYAIHQGLSPLND